MSTNDPSSTGGRPETGFPPGPAYCFPSTAGLLRRSRSDTAPVAPARSRERGHPMPSAIIPGAVFPDYALPDHTGTVRTLSELQGTDPMILTLARGHYCPKEHQQHLELAAHYPKIAVAYTQIVTIAT